MASVQNVSNGKATGGVTKAPLGSALPTDTTTPLDPAFVKQGLVGEEGLAPGGERSIESIMDWNGDEIASLQTEHTVEFTFTLLEVFNADTMKTIFGDENVTETAATTEHGKIISVTEDGSELANATFAFDMSGLGKKKIRIVVPNGKVTTVEENPFVSGELNSFNVTVKAYKDDTGVKVYRYYDDGKVSAV